MAMLRDELGYDGLVFSDDIEMKALADHFSVEDRSLGVLRAGVDVVMACSQTDLREEVLGKLERAPDELLEHALRRMIAFKQRFGASVQVVPLTELVSTPANEVHGLGGPPFASHVALAERLATGGVVADASHDPTERA
jgi:beta-N-acetylhexosaminidase